MMDESRLAPPDVSWHEEYERWLHTTIAGLKRLQDHPSFDDGEDLKDYVECVATLLTFAPRTVDRIVSKVNAEMGFDS